MLRPSLVAPAVAVALVTALASCASQEGVGPLPDVTIGITADVSATSVATIVVQVTATDIPTALVFNIPIVNGVASGTITVPAGSNRTILIRGYDAGGVATHSGSVTLSVQAGSNPAVSIVLTPLTGDVPITASLGQFVVTVAPSSATLAIAGTKQLTATIKDTQGNTVSGVVSWATLNPGVATVDAAGLVTATGAGNTTISAVFNGVTGIATITVTP